MIEFYNAVYKANPHKWAHPARDEFAFAALSRRISEPATMLDIGCGNGQMEWHLTRPHWEEIIRENGFEIVEALTGDRPEWQFIFILRAK